MCDCSHGWTAVSGGSEILSASNIVELARPHKLTSLRFMRRSAAWLRTATRGT